MNNKIENILSRLESVLAEFNGIDPDVVYVVLDDDPIFVEMLNRKFGDDANFKGVTTYEEFNAAIRNNGKKILVLDIYLDNALTGIEFAEKLNLKSRCKDLMFISNVEPTAMQMAKIEEMGARFEIKSDDLVERIRK